MEAITGLHQLRDGCSHKQLALRDKAFEKAEEFISDGPYQSITPIVLSFQNRNLSKRQKDARVDIEIIHGVAFV